MRTQEITARLLRMGRLTLSSNDASGSVEQLGLTLLRAGILAGRARLESRGQAM